MKFSFIGIAPLHRTGFMKNAQNVIMGDIMFGYLMIGMKFLVKNVLTHAKHMIEYIYETNGPVAKLVNAGRRSCERDCKPLVTSVFESRQGHYSKFVEVVI